MIDVKQELVFYERPVNDLLMMIRNVILDDPRIIDLIELPKIEDIDSIKQWIEDNAEAKKEFIDEAANKDTIPNWNLFLKRKGKEEEIRKEAEPEIILDFDNQTLIECLDKLKVQNPQNESENKEVKKKFLKLFLSLWLFEYNEFTDEITSRYIFSPVTPHHADLINKKTIIPYGQGSVGYSVKKKEPIAINNTEEDPRGSVSIEDKLLRNFSYLAVPVCDADKVIYIYSIFLPYTNAWIKEGKDGSDDKTLENFVKKVIDKYCSNFIAYYNYSMLKKMNNLIAERDKVRNEEGLLEVCHNLICQSSPILVTGLFKEKTGNGGDFKLCGVPKINIRTFKARKRKEQYKNCFSLTGIRNTETYKKNTEETFSMNPSTRIEPSFEDSKNIIFIVNLKGFKLENKDDSDYENLKIMFNEISNIVDETFKYIDGTNNGTNKVTLFKDKLNICSFIVNYFFDFFLDREYFPINYMITSTGLDRIIDDFKSKLGNLLSPLVGKSQDTNSLLKNIDSHAFILDGIEIGTKTKERIIELEVYLKNDDLKIIINQQTYDDDFWHPSNISILQLVNEEKFTDILTKYPPQICIDHVQETKKGEHWLVIARKNEEDQEEISIELEKVEPGKGRMPVYYYLNSKVYENLTFQEIENKPINKSFFSEENYSKIKNNFPKTIFKILHIENESEYSEILRRIDKDFVLIFLGEDILQKNKINKEYDAVLNKILENYKISLEIKEKRDMEVKISQSRGWTHQLIGRLFTLKVLADVIERENAEKGIKYMDVLTKKIHLDQKCIKAIQEQDLITKDFKYQMKNLWEYYPPLKLKEQIIYDSLKHAFLRIGTESRLDYIDDRREIFRKEFLKIDENNENNSVGLDAIKKLLLNEIESTGNDIIVYLNSITKLKIELISDNTTLYVAPLIAQSLQFHVTEIFTNALKHFHKMDDNEKFIQIEIDNRILNVDIESKNYTMNPISDEAKVRMSSYNIPEDEKVYFITLKIKNSFTTMDKLPGKDDFVSSKIGLSIIHDAIKRYFIYENLENELVKINTLDDRKNFVDFEKYIADKKLDRSEILEYEISIPIPIIVES